MEAASYILAVGTYTNGKSKGLYSFSLDPHLTKFEEMASIRVSNPSYIATVANKKFIYTVSENIDKPSYANALTIDRKTGHFKMLGRRITKGSGPCNIAVDPEFRFVATANYGGGSISVFPLGRDGSLEPLSQLIQFSGEGRDPERQDAPHIHCVGFSPDGNYMFATDLGTDRIYRFDIDNTEGIFSLKENSKIYFPADSGSGPRHFLFSADGRFFYVINELYGTVTSFFYENGNLMPFQTIIVDENYRGNGGDIVLTPDGKYLYASMREGNDGIGVFSVDKETGLLEKTDYILTATHPRNLSVSPDGKVLLSAALKDNLIEAYSINPQTGRLDKTAACIKIDSPAYVGFI